MQLMWLQSKVILRIKQRFSDKIQLSSGEIKMNANSHRNTVSNMS